MLGGNRRNPLLHQGLEVMAPGGLVDSVDPLGVVDVLNQILQLGGRIPRKSREACFLPEACQNIQITAAMT